MRAPDTVLPPPDPPMVPIVAGGMVLWVIAGLVALPFRHTHPDWVWICVAGFLWGIPGLLMMLRRNANRRRRAEAARAAGITPPPT